MSALDPDMAADIRAGELEAKNAGLALSEFHVACQFQQWERAEDARQRVLAHQEASMDAFARAHRRLEVMRGRP